MANARRIEVAELYDLQAESSALHVIDVREPHEIDAVRTAFATTLPLSQLSMGDLGAIARLDRSETIYVLCRSGARSLRACGLLSDAGFGNVVNVDGGILAWEAAGLPVLRGR